MIYPFNAGEVFKIALNIEDNGYAFYEQAADKPFPEEIKKLFQMLGKEEMAHKRIFSRLMEGLPPQTTSSTVWDPQDEVDQYLKMMADTHVFLQHPEKITEGLKLVATPQEAVEMAMQFEKDTIVFFLQLADASDGTESQKNIQTLVHEEQKHLKALTLILKKLNTPK